MTPTFLTGPQLCELLAITTSQLSSRVHRVKDPLPSVSVSDGHARRFPLVGVVEWIARNSTPATSPEVVRGWLGLEVAS